MFRCVRAQQVGVLFSTLFCLMDPGVQGSVAEPLPEAAIVKGACRRSYLHAYVCLCVCVCIYIYVCV